MAQKDLIELLKTNENKLYTTKELSLCFDINEQSIRRSLNKLQEIFPIYLVEKGNNKYHVYIGVEKQIKQINKKGRKKNINKKTMVDFNDIY